MITDDLLSRLDRVKHTGTQQWVSRCPAHDSKGQKLSISEAEDGRILLKCWSRGCHPTQIVDAVGLTMSDLFPEHMRYKNQHPLPKGQRFLPRTILTALSEEIMVVALCADIILKGDNLSQEAIIRLKTAGSRLYNAINEVAHD